MPNTLATILAAAATLVLLSSVTSEAGGFKAKRFHADTAATLCDTTQQSPGCEPSGKGAELDMINVQSVVLQQQRILHVAANVMSQLGNCDVCGNIR